ncbi:Uncharacterised protein [uncultured archaeon]|nr:Uncharacterised protein [uncultured archaeon]
MKAESTEGNCTAQEGGSGCRMKNKSGFVFSIDATLALFLLVLVLITVVFLSSQAEESPYVKLQVLRSAKDVLIVMDKAGIVAGGNASAIESALNSTLPVGVGAHLQVSTYYLDGGSFSLVNVSEYGEAVPENITIYGARRDFASFKNNHITNYSVVRMSVWQK